MLLSNEIDELISILRNNDALSDCKIIKAYPLMMKPTMLDKTVIALSLGEIEADNIELGGDCRYGYYKINLNIYCPYDLGANALENVVSNIVQSLSGTYPASVSVSEINKNELIECLFVKCSFTYNGAMNFGGVANE